jgi:hypothetical protein
LKGVTQMYEMIKWAIRLLLVALVFVGNTATAEIVYFSVSGGGGSHLPIFGKFLDIQILNGSGSLDTESGRFEMIVKKRVTSWLVGSADITTHHIITPDHFEGRDLYFGPAEAERAMLVCEPIKGIVCDGIPFPAGEFISWESLFGSAKGARLTFLGKKEDFYGSGLEMPVTIADGSVLRIVWASIFADEFIDFQLSE